MSLPEAQPAPLEPAALKLYVFGSCESDQYYHPRQDNESKRPICLTDIENFQPQADDEEDQDEHPDKVAIPNPLRNAAILKIACGALHTVVATVEGKVFTFGCNDEGALGREGPEKLPTEVRLDYAIDLISAGDNHSIFASSGAGKVYFTGNYKYMRGEKMVEPVKVPELFDINAISNRGNAESKLTKVVSGSNHSAILLAEKIYIRGQPEAHTVGRRINARHKTQSSLTFQSVGISNVEDVWCGGYHTIAKVRKGKGWSYHGWGLNEHGQLGVGTYEESPYPVQITKLRNKNVVDVAAGTNFTILLTAEGELLGCGQNDEGQLGLGEDYKFVDSDAEEENQLEAQIQQNLNIHQAEKPQEEGNVDLAHEPVAEGHEPVAEGHEPVAEGQEQHQEPPKEEQAKEDEHGEEQGEGGKKKLKEQNIYIKSLRPIPIPSKVTHLSAGSEFVYAWNEKEVYSWGFGMNYVLLNGEEENETQPFKVKPKILNEHAIHQLSAGAQHVAYLSYPQQSRPPRVELSEKARKQSLDSRKKLSRRKRSPAKK